MNWTGRFTDDGARLRRIRLITLQGQERTLAHQRELLRRDLSVELQQHCRAGPKTAEAIVLEQRIRAVHAEWLDLIVEIRALKGEKAA